MSKEFQLLGLLGSQGNYIKNGHFMTKSLIYLKTSTNEKQYHEGNVSTFLTAIAETQKLSRLQTCRNQYHTGKN